MVEEKLITKEEALRRIQPMHVQQILDGTHVTPAGEKELKEALPELEITISRPRVASK